MQGFYVIIPVSYLLVTSDALESQCASSEGPFDPAFVAGGHRCNQVHLRFLKDCPTQSLRPNPSVEMCCSCCSGYSGADGPGWRQQSSVLEPQSTRQHQFCESVSHWTSAGWWMVDFPTCIEGKIWVAMGGYPSSFSPRIAPYCPIQPLSNTCLGGICWYISGVLSQRYPTFPFECSMYPQPSICLGLQKFLWFSAITVGTNHPHCFYTLQRWPAFFGSTFVALYPHQQCLAWFWQPKSIMVRFWLLTRSAFGNLARYWGFYLNRSLTTHPNLNLRKFLDRNQPFQPACDSPSNPRHHSCKLGSAAHASARWPSALENAKSWQHQPPGFFSVKHVLRLRASTFNPNNLFYKDSRNFCTSKKLSFLKHRLCIYFKFRRHNLCELHWISADFTLTCNLSSLNHETSSFVGHSMQNSDSVWDLQRMAGMFLADRMESWPARIIEAALQNPQ